MASTITAKIDFNPATIAAKRTRKVNLAQAWLDNEVLKDSAQYVPRITGALESSGIDGTVIGSGEIAYNSKYAKKQYYGEFKHSTQAHPKATRLWFETAKSVNKAKWVRGVKSRGGG